MIPSIWSSVLILFCLVAIFTGSWAMFWLLSHRSTSQRYWVALGEWGRERGIRLRRCDEMAPPSPLDVIASQRIEMRLCLRGRRVQLLQVESISPAGTVTAADSALPRPGTWNVLIRDITIPWPSTALRPTSLRSSLIDLFALPSHPLLGASERFVVQGLDSQGAAALTRSSARGLLPPDVGLLLHGRILLLDFSARPFDTIEFERMIAVADQVIAHLPAPDASG